MKIVNNFSAYALIAAISLSIPAHAEDIILVTGLRPEALDETIASVSVITDNELDIRNSPYLADQLRAVPGVGVSRSGANGGLTQVRLRGAEANHTLFLVDGIEVSDPVTGETDFGLWSGFDAGRIEVLRGEQSGIYGSDAIGGVINVVPAVAEGVSASAEAGSFSTARGTARYGFNSDTLELSTAVSGYRTDGIDTSGSGGEKDGAASVSLSAHGVKTFNEKWSARGLFRYSEDTVDTDADTDFDGLLNDTDRTTDSEQFLIGGSIEGDTDRVSHIIRASYTRVERTNDADGVFADETIGSRTKISYSPSLSHVHDNTTYSITGLIDYEDEEYERISTDVIFGDPNQSQAFQSLGNAVELRAQSERLSFSGSVRHDDNDDKFDDAITWRAGAAIKLHHALRLRASAGTGVKNPTFTELFGFFPGSFVGNPDLKPETSTSYEIGIDHPFPNGKLSAVYFSAELEDEIFTVFNPDFTSSPANRAGKSERSGIEISGNLKVNESLSLSASVTNLSSQNEAGEDEIRVPETTASLSAHWQSQATPGFGAGLAFDYVGEQNDFRFTFPLEEKVLPSYVLTTATLSYPIVDGVSLTARGENLFDEEIVDVFGFAQTGAGIFIGLKIE